MHELDEYLNKDCVDLVMECLFVQKYNNVIYALNEIFDRYNHNEKMKKVIVDIQIILNLKPYFGFRESIDYLNNPEYNELLLYLLA